MDRIEKDLEKLRFSPPPRWLRARVLVAAQNASEPLRRRKRIATLVWIAIAAAVMLGVLGHYVAGILAPITGGKAPSPAVQAGPLEPLGGALDAAQDSGTPAGAPAQKPADEQPKKTDATDAKDTR